MNLFIIKNSDVSEIPEGLDYCKEIEISNLARGGTGFSQVDKGRKVLIHFVGKEGSDPFSRDQNLLRDKGDELLKSPAAGFRQSK